MKLVLLLSLLSVMVSGGVCQYSCPLIQYTQSIEPVSSTLFPGSAAYKLSFVNHSPQLPLAFLDVHYAINNADTNNIRLISSSPTGAVVAGEVPPFLLGDSDQLDYQFTYSIKGYGLACDTHHFQVTGKEIKEHAMMAKEADKSDMKADPKAVNKESDRAKEKEMEKEPADKHTIASVDDQAKQDTTIVSTESRTLPTLHETGPTLVIPPLGLSDIAPAARESMEPIAPAIAPAVDRMAEPLDLNAGVCPLIPFTHELTRAPASASASTSASGADMYKLAFHNQSPTQPLAFLDVHFTINGGPTANLRLFSDHSNGGSEGVSALAANEARGLGGIAAVSGDEISYSFTYGIKEARSGMDGKVRACNTEVYKVKIDDNIK